MAPFRRSLERPGRLHYNNRPGFCTIGRGQTEMLELSRKSDYALRAVIYLARLSSDRYGRVSEIAKAKDIPQ